MSPIVQRFTGEQKAFIEKELGISRTVLGEMDDDELDDNVYLPLFDIECEEITGDFISERGRVAADIVDIIADGYFGGEEYDDEEDA